jgi:hypothetical protein
VEGASEGLGEKQRACESEGRSGVRWPGDCNDGGARRPVEGAEEGHELAGIVSAAAVRSDFHWQGRSRDHDEAIGCAVAVSEGGGVVRSRHHGLLKTFPPIAKPLSFSPRA